MNFNELTGTLGKINAELQEHSLHCINTSLTLRNWFFGFYIVEFEQHGKDRATYGNGLLSNLARVMQSRAIPNCDERELRRYRRFYCTYPQIIPQLTGDTFRGLISSAMARWVEETRQTKRGMPLPELQLPVSQYDNLLV